MGGHARYTGAQSQKNYIRFTGPQGIVLLQGSTQPRWPETLPVGSTVLTYNRGPRTRRVDQLYTIREHNPHPATLRELVWGVPIPREFRAPFG